MKYKLIYFLVSVIFISIGILSIIVWGFRYSIDFAGGTNLLYKINSSVAVSNVKEIFTKNTAEVISIEKDKDVFRIRTKAIDETKETIIRNDIEKKLNVKILLQRFETVGPVLGRETLIKTAVASLIAVVGILIYMSFAFKSLNFAFSAILAMIHDFLIVVGSYSLLSHFFGAELDTLFVTALLTSMSFSVHDTIVIFDKIREYKRSEGIQNIEHSANQALTETLVRSLNNSMTIIFMLLSLTLLGGSTIRFFVVTLLIGTITGTYSSPFIATPILVFLEKRNIKK